MRICTLVRNPDLFKPRFLRLDQSAGLSSPIAGLSPRIPNSTGSGVCGTQTTTSFAVSTVSQVCGNVACFCIKQALPVNFAGSTPVVRFPVHKDFRSAIFQHRLRLLQLRRSDRAGSSSRGIGPQPLREVLLPRQSGRSP